MKPIDPAAEEAEAIRRLTAAQLARQRSGRVTVEPRR